MTATNFNDLLKRAQADFDNVKRTKRRSFVKITAEEFKEVFLLRVNTLLKKRGKDVEFSIDENNRKVINQLFYYLVGASNFDGDFNKGIMLLGNLGSGKTLIMQAFCTIWDDVMYLKMKQISAKKYVDFLANPDKQMTQHGVPNYEIGTLFIDDLGKEAKKINVYGTEICPIADLFAARYDNGGMTFVTGNYKLETLQGQYGETVTDRMKEMFNILILKGESRRK